MLVVDRARRSPYRSGHARGTRGTAPSIGDKEHFGFHRPEKVAVSVAKRHVASMATKATVGLVSVNVPDGQPLV